MFIERTTNNVRNLFVEYNKLDLKEKLQASITIFEEWANNQINSLNEANPDLLQDDVDIDIFNPQSIGYENDVHTIAQDLFLIINKRELENIESIVIDTTLSNQINYTEETKKLLSAFEKLMFIEKIDVIAEMLLMIEAETLIENLKYSGSGTYNYDIVALILEYKKNMSKNNKSTFPYKLSE